MPPVRPGRSPRSVRFAPPLLLIFLLLAAATQVQDRDADGVLDSVEAEVRSLDPSKPDPDTDRDSLGEVRDTDTDRDGVPDGVAAPSRTAQSFSTGKTTEAPPSDNGQVITARHEPQICFRLESRRWA